jgi:hypothetical protein
MKKILLFAIIALLSFNNAQAQLPNGSTAPDFTLVDLNGTSHNLYTYLDSGYTVFIDFSAIWCPPCWSYHASGALEDLYIHHGPAGMPNVNPNTTDDVMVFFIEGDEGTLAELNGGPGSQGDWVTGTPYPIIPTYTGSNSTQVTSDYQIGYWPTVYQVCPDRILSECGTSASPYSLVSACLPPASNNDDARTFNYAGETVTCEGDLVPEIMIQNYGLTNLTSLSIEVNINGASQSITPWTGNLSTYATDNVTLPTLIGLANNDLIAIDVSLPNGVVDQDSSNNPTISFNITLATQNTNPTVTINITTDQYGAETTWDLKNSTGQIITSGGPYANLQAIGTTPQTPITIPLSAQECHTFTILDAYGDGMNAGFGIGSFTVVDGNGTTLVSGGTFTDQDEGVFKTGNAPPPSWDCDSQGNCSDPGTGNGQYTSNTACLTACVAVSWDCNPATEFCEDPGTGLGQYISIDSCQADAACVTTAINEDISNLSVYPNPVKDVLTIEGNYTSVDIYDVFGKLVLSAESAKTINVSALSSGIYMLNINTEKETTTQKITINK